MVVVVRRRNGQWAGRKSPTAAALDKQRLKNKEKKTRRKNRIFSAEAMQSALRARVVVQEGVRQPGINELVKEYHVPKTSFLRFLKEIEGAPDKLAALEIFQLPDLGKPSYFTPAEENLLVGTALELNRIGYGLSRIELMARARAILKLTHGMSDEDSCSYK
jgi:hypothetical protein